VQGAIHNVRYVATGNSCACCRKRPKTKQESIMIQWRNIRGLNLHMPHVMAAGVHYQLLSEADVAEHEVPLLSKEAKECKRTIQFGRTT
jgi:hypothetical protein